MQNILIYGNGQGAGLAAQMAAAALSQALPQQVNITLLSSIGEESDPSDILYGSLLPPKAYDIHLKCGLTEPELLMGSDAAFSFGTGYQQWTERGLNWMQCFHLPLPVIGNVEFQQCLLRAGITDLEPYLVSAQAAKAGVFAHPPEDNKSPLSRAEYGYQISPQQYKQVLDKNRAQSIDIIHTDQIKVNTRDQGIESLTLGDGRVLKADWFIDCSGPQATLLTQLGINFQTERSVEILASQTPEQNPVKPYRTVSAADYGWQSDTPLRGSRCRLTVYDSDSEEQAARAHGDQVDCTISNTQIGQRAQAWQGNCVALGLAAAVTEPLTHSPITLLYRDIERLLELVPISENMSVERTEFNRRFVSDYEHASLFNRAFYACEGLPETPYWQRAKAQPVPEKLQIKLQQFASRALLVRFDLEPFNEQDWLILLMGIQRSPRRYNRLADQFDPGLIEKQLQGMAQQIQQLVSKMPPLERYMKKLLEHLKNQV